MFRLTVKCSFALGLAVCLAGLGIARADDDDEKKADAPKARIAVFRLRGDFSESPVRESIFGTTGGRMSFRDLVSRLKKAGDDSAIKAIFWSPKTRSWEAPSARKCARSWPGSVMSTRKKSLSIL